MFSIFSRRKYYEYFIWKTMIRYIPLRRHNDSPVLITCQSNVLTIITVREKGVSIVINVTPHVLIVEKRGCVYALRDQSGEKYSPSARYTPHFSPRHNDYLYNRFTNILSMCRKYIKLRNIPKLSREIFLKNSTSLFLKKKQFSQIIRTNQYTFLFNYHLDYSRNICM